MLMLLLLLASISSLPFFLCYLPPEAALAGSLARYWAGIPISMSILLRLQHSLSPNAVGGLPCMLPLTLWKHLWYFHSRVVPFANILSYPAQTQFSVRSLPCAPSPRSPGSSWAAVTLQLGFLQCLGCLFLTSTARQ